MDVEVAAAVVADVAEDKNRLMDYTSDPIWLRIDGLIFDDNSHPLTFSKRLARENRWAHWFALDVMEEYKKFLYLMAVSDHPVTPSIEVDQVWHLHLYTHANTGMTLPSICRLSLIMALQKVEVKRAKSSLNGILKLLRVTRMFLA